MDATGTPTPPQACVGDYVTAASAECGQAMQSLCTDAVSQMDPQTGIETVGSQMLAPGSNCATWRDAIQVVSALELAPAGGTPYLDAAIRSYCGDHLTAPECACVNWPTNAASACGDSDCGGTPSQCLMDEIVQSSGAGNSQVEVIELGSCAPPACWLSACFDGRALLTSDILAQQMTPTGCPPWCIQVTSESSININVLPPQTVDTIDAAIIEKCGDELKGPLLYTPPVTYGKAANALMSVALPFSNGGDMPAVFDVVSITNADNVPLALYPSVSVLVPGRTIRPIVLEASQPVLAQRQAAMPSGTYTWQPTITVTYPDAHGTLTSFSTSPTWRIVPASPPIRIPRTAVPKWFYTAAVFGVLVLLASVAAVLVNMRAVERDNAARDAAAARRRAEVARHAREAARSPSRSVHTQLMRALHR